MFMQISPHALSRLNNLCFKQINYSSKAFSIEFNISSFIPSLHYNILLCIEKKTQEMIAQVTFGLVFTRFYTVSVTFHLPYTLN